MENAVIGGVGMLLGHCAQKSLNSIEKMQQRMMCASFNEKPCESITSFNSPSNASDETEIITFYNDLSSLIRRILKHNLQIIGGDMNAQIGKDENNKLC